MVSVGSVVTRADIVAIQSKIQSEAAPYPTGREVTDYTTPLTVGNPILSEHFDDMINTNTNINAAHCWCQSYGLIERHDGGQSLSLTASTADHDVGDEINAAGINEINADINNLVAQCNCDSHVQDCFTNCTCENQCTCDDICFCNADCVCTCYPLGCHPDVSCGCMCDDTYCYCNSDWGCNCDGQGCGCNTDCSCNTVCGCEYGG